MSDILKSILGFVIDKARSATANSLSDGDLTDERMREVIISNIDDIKSSLRGLAKQHLNSSLSFLKEGISRMGLAVQDTSASTQNVQTVVTHATEEFVTTGAGADEILSLSNLQIVLQDRWVRAKESFKTSSEHATIAFSNTALSIEDRIMACKLRISSSILETFFDDPEDGAQDCLLYLQELHELPAIRETFTVHHDGGLKSRFNKTKRSEIVETLTGINDILWDFIVNSTKMIGSRSFEWPVIQLTNSERKIHSFEPEYKMKQIVLQKANEKDEENRIKLMGKRWPNFEFSDDIKKEFDLQSRNPVAVNSAGRIYWDNFYSTESDDKLVENHEYFYVKVASLDIGPGDDSLYALEYVTNALEANDSYIRLKVDDLKNKSCREFTKGLPPTTHDTLWIMRVLENKIVLCNGFGEVFVLTRSDTQDQLNTKCSFSLPLIYSPRGKPKDVRMEPYMCATDKHEVIIAVSHGKEVYICPITEKGQTEEMIRVPLQQHETESEVCGVAFDVTHEEDIVVLRNTPHLHRGFQIDVYSRNGDVRNVYPLAGSSPFPTCFLLSNSKGIVAVIQNNPNWRSNSMRCWHLVGKVFVHRDNPKGIDHCNCKTAQ